MEFNINFGSVIYHDIMSFTKDNKLMSFRILLVFLAVIGLQQLNGQHTFHRNYPPVGDKNTITISSIQLKSGNYATMELQVDVNDLGESYSDTLIISTFKAKGDLDWSKAIYLNNGFKGFAANGTLLQAPNDSLYFSIVSTQLDKPNILIGSIGNGGRLGYLRSFGNDLNLAYSFGGLLTNDNSSLYSAYSYIDNSEQHGGLSRKRFNGTTLWSKKYDAKVADVDVDENIVSVSYNLDTTILMSGVVDSNFSKSFLMVTDTLGKILWSKYYYDDESLLGIPIVNASKQAKDGSYVMAGSNIEFIPPQAITIKGFIIKTDTIGNVLWSKRVIFDTDVFTLLTEMTVDKKGDILVSGFNIDLANADVYRFVIKFDDQGKTIWQKRYPNFQSQNQGGQIFETSDGGYGITYTALDGDKTFTSLIKTDKDGKSSCESDIEDVIVFDHRFLADTLIWIQEDDVILSDTVSKKSINFAYDIPVLSLDTKTFCPNEPIDWTFRATIPGATNYKWSTGDEGATLDTLRVMEEGEYSVTVTVGEGVCYMLCDTAKIERYKEPKAALSTSLGKFCENGKLTLNAGYTPGHPSTKSYTWSTGDKDINNIEIANPGKYSVTIVDQCNEVAIANIDVGAFPTKITSVGITNNVTVDCNIGSISGNLIAKGNAIGLLESTQTYKWSTSPTDTSAALVINKQGIYTVTATDACGKTASTSIEIELKGTKKFNINITANEFGECENRGISLNAVSSVQGIYKYKWNTNASDTFARIDVKSAGTYTVTVTDKCGNTASDSKSITISEIQPPDLLYANLFFPTGVGLETRSQDTMGLADAIKYNRTFGPVNLAKYCLSAITKYELYVYNRWGQLVFESDSVAKEWDGTNKGSEAPTETYLYIARYTIFGVEKVKKGSIQLIRR